MAANDVQIRISAKDFASSTLRNVSNSAQQTAQSFNTLGTAAGNLVFNAAGITAGIAGFQGLTAAMQGTIGSVSQFARSMETNQIGIAGILSSMTQINGKNLEWNQAMGLSKSLMRQLNDEALRTNATTEELTTTFRALLGPGLGAGMKVEEIIKLSSVGATAVKSLGLNGTQLVQELRDLVQGGIQPASSTLATALGLKDKDIQKAKESSEGLFKFLMERLEGFSAAGEASKKTLDGIIDQIKEGTQRIGAEATTPIYGAMKQELAEIANSLIYTNEETKKVELNPQILNDLTYASTKTVEISKNVIDIAKSIGEVATPAARVFGNALVFVGENIKTIGTGLAAWYAIGRITSLYNDISLAANGATAANTMLGKAVLTVRNDYMAQAVAARQTAEQEMQAAVQASATIQAESKARIAAKKQEQIVTQAAIAAEMAGWENLAVRIANLKAEYMQLGATAEQAGAMQLQAARAAQGGHLLLTQQIIASQRAHLEAASAARVSEVAAVSGSAKAASAVKTLGAAVWALAGGWLGVAAATGYALYKLYEYQKNKNAIMQPDYTGANVRWNLDKQYWEVERAPDSNHMFSYYDDATPAEAEKINLTNKKNKEREIEMEKSLFNDGKSEVDQQLEDFKNLGVKFPSVQDDGGKAARKAAKEAERAAEEKARLQDKVADMIASFDKKITGENGTAYEVGMKNLNEEIANTRRELDKNRIDFEKYGIDITGVEEKITEYQTVMNKKLADEQLRNLGLLKNEAEAIKATLNDDFAAKAQAEYETALINIENQRKDKYKESGDQGAADTWADQKKAEAEEKKIQDIRKGYLAKYNNAVEHNTMLIELEGRTQIEVDALNKQELQSKIAYLNTELKNAKLTRDERIAIEKEKYDAIKSLNDIASNDMTTALGIHLEELRKQAHNWKSVYDSAFSSIESNVEDHLNNMVSRTESFSDGIVGIFENMAGQIRKLWIEMWYEQTIKKPLMSWWGKVLGGIGGGGSGGGFNYTSQYGIDYSSPPTFANGGGFNYTSQYGIDYSSPPTFANGGDHMGGWAVVGEEGPELAYFGNRARIYDAKTSNKMLSTMRQTEMPDITVNVINKSGTEVKATATSKMDNPKNMIIQIVAEAIPRNEGGLQDLIAGVANR